MPLNGWQYEWREKSVPIIQNPPTGSCELCVALREAMAWKSGTDGRALENIRIHRRPSSATVEYLGGAGRFHTVSNARSKFPCTQAQADIGTDFALLYAHRPLPMTQCRTSVLSHKTQFRVPQPREPPCIEKDSTTNRWSFLVGLIADSVELTFLWRHCLGGSNLVGNASVFPPTLHSLGPGRLSFIQHQMENCLSNPQHACELGLDHNDTDWPTRILKIRLTEDIYIHKHPRP